MPFKEIIHIQWKLYEIHEYKMQSYLLIVKAGGTKCHHWDKKARSPTKATRLQCDQEKITFQSPTGRTFSS
jgi:hypothetical protein